MSALNIQNYLFQRIRERLPVDASLADIVAGLLYVSNDSAYRRIRGETPLDPYPRSKNFDAAAAALSRRPIPRAASKPERVGAMKVPFHAIAGANGALAQDREPHPHRAIELTAHDPCGRPRLRQRRF